MISRKPGTLQIEAIHAATLATLLEALRAIDPQENWIFSDLSLGGWHGHHVAAEFCGQLGIAPPALVTPSNVGDNARPQLADTIARLVDAEGAGNRVIQGALESAERILSTSDQRTRRTFVLLMPRFGIAWEPENTIFLRFLAQGMSGTLDRLLLVGTDEATTVKPDGFEMKWRNQPGTAAAIDGHGMIGLVPGLVEPLIAESISKAEPTGSVQHSKLRLRNGYQLIAPEHRQSPGQTACLEFDRLIAVARCATWLQVYAQLYGSPTSIDCEMLRAEAERRFAEGGYSIALRLLQRAIECAQTSLERGVALAQAQGFRIALLQFDQTAAADSDSAELPESLRGSLLLAKAWGQVMIGAHELAETNFREALDLLMSRPFGRECLYWWNIYALNRLRLGDVEGALKIEKQIEETLESLPDRDWHLQYVNSINQARLYWRKRDLDQSALYYQRAFETTLGVRSESDAIYTNLCRARLLRDQARPRESLLSWLRAALHWVAASVPEALAPRTAGGLLRRRIGYGEDVIEEVSAVLCGELARAAGAVDIGPIESDTGPASSVAFSKVSLGSNRGFSGATVVAWGGPGWGVLVSQSEIQPQFDGEQTRRLRSAISMLLGKLSAGALPGTPVAIFIHDRFGLEIPTTAMELLETCVRLRVPRMVFDGQSITLDEPTLAKLEANSRVRLSNAVNRVNLNGSGRPQIAFKRYLNPMLLSAEHVRIVELLESQPTIAELSRILAQTDSDHSVRALIRSLEQARVVDVYIPPEACSDIGKPFPRI